MIKQRKKPYTIEGSYRDWVSVIESSEFIDDKTKNKAAEDLNVIHEYLKGVRNGTNPAAVGILMKIPYTKQDVYCIVGPTFAALLLRKYELAGEIMDQEEFEEYGVVLDDFYNDSSCDIFYDHSQIHISELILADMKIPASLMEKMVDQFNRRGIVSVDGSNITANRMMNILGPSDFYRDPFFEDDHESKRVNRYEKIFNKCPDMFDWLFDIIAFRIGGYRFFNTYGLNWVLELGDTVYSHYGFECKAVLGMFAEETKCYLTSRGSGDHKKAARFCKAANFVLNKISSDRELLRCYLKLILLVINVVENSLMFTCFSDSENKPYPIVKRLTRILDKVRTLQMNADFTAEELCVSPNNDPERFSINNAVNIDETYYANYLEVYKKYFNNRIEIDTNGELFNDFITRIRHTGMYVIFGNNPFGNEKRDSDVASLKRFIFNTDSFKVDNIESAETAYVMNGIMELADEEIIILCYKKHLFEKENTQIYINIAINNKKYALLPCLSAYL